MARPLLVALPHGLCVSGVTTWAARLAEERARLGRPSGLLLHREPAAHRRLDVDPGPGVELFDLTGLPPLETAHADLSPYIDRYADAARRFAARHGSPAVLSPNLLGDCYGIAAAVSRRAPESVRVVGWAHADLEYNYRVLAHYEPVIARFVAVSDRIEERLREVLPARRARDVVNIPYGVPVAAHPAPRAPIAGRPVRLVYTGRFDHEQKRVMALVELARELAGRGISHEIAAIGDGPAASEFDLAVRGLPTVRRLPPAAPSELARRLQESDAFVLGSRYEGLSVSMLEAMAHGCVPIVTNVESGAAQAIERGTSGELADVPDGASDAEVAAALADAVERFLARTPRAMSEAAWRAARRRFSLERHVEDVEAVISAVASEQPRAWPADAPCAFPSVPSDGAARMASALAVLGGRRIIVHGTGRHTRQLGDVLAGSPAQIVAFADDDRQAHGATLWGLPVIAPNAAAATGATDVVISSWINQQAIWGRRAVYESQGLRVHRVYD